MSDSFSCSLDPGSLEEIAHMLGFQALFDPEIVAALAEAGHLLVSAAQANTWEVFANPTGELASDITFEVLSPTEVAVISNSPYGRRRELGFSGLTDALGRYYPNDPGKPYMQPAVDANVDAISEIMELAVNNALGRIVA